MKSTLGPAYKVVTPRLVIRCWKPADAPLLTSAINASLDHLTPWMPWISQEPISPEERVDMLRRFVAEFELRQDFVYGIFSLDESQVLGGTGLHTRRGKDVREIGYWIHADYTRQGLATESTMALVRVAIEIDQVRRVEIRNDPKNLASRAIPKKLGFTREDILEGDPEFPGAGRDTEIWSLLASFYSSSPALQLQIKAFDAFNQPIPLE